MLNVFNVRLHDAQRPRIYAGVEFEIRPPSH